jgi:hypothetical protein
MPKIKTIRFIILFSGLVMMGVVIASSVIASAETRNIEDDYPLFIFIIQITGGIFMICWNLLPFLIYFLITKNYKSVYRALIPGIMLSGTQLYLLVEFFHSVSSTAGLIFVMAPIYSGVALLAGILLVRLPGGRIWSKNKGGY